MASSRFIRKKRITQRRGDSRGEGLTQRSAETQKKREEDWERGVDRFKRKQIPPRISEG
jgi:hypothetical protein